MQLPSLYKINEQEQGPRTSRTKVILDKHRQSLVNKYKKNVHPNRVQTETGDEDDDKTKYFGVSTDTHETSPDQSSVALKFIDRQKMKIAGRDQRGQMKSQII